MIPIEDFIKHATNNRSKIFQDEKVSCYYCCKTFLGKYIEEYTATNDAICPCGIDSIIPFEVDEKTLEEAHRYYFGFIDEPTKEDRDKEFEEIVKELDGIFFIKEV